jgi:hypothetical protein
MIGMKLIETTKCSNNAFNRIPTPLMANVNLAKHNNNNDKIHEYLPCTELPLNVIDYCYVPRRTLMVRIYTNINEANLNYPTCKRKKKTILLCL